MEPGEDPLEFDFKKAYAEKDVEKMDELLVGNFLKYLCLDLHNSFLEQKQNPAFSDRAENEWSQSKSIEGVRFFEGEDASVGFTPKNRKKWRCCSLNSISYKFFGCQCEMIM